MLNSIVGVLETASAGTDYLTPSGSAANLTDFPTFNQNTSGTASNLSGTPALPNGTTATTQTQGSDDTKIATTAYVDTGLGDIGIADVHTAGTHKIPFSNGTNLTESSNLTWDEDAQSLVAYGSLTLMTSIRTPFITPQGASVGTRINIPTFNLNSFEQIMMMGIPAGSAVSARVFSICDARTVAHQPSIGVFNPGETDIMGFSWEGSEDNGFIKSLGASFMGFKAGTNVLGGFGTDWSTHNWLSISSKNSSSVYGALTVDNDGVMSIVTSNNTIVLGSSRTPGSTGMAGEVCWDANNIYVCVATDTWKRIPIGVSGVVDLADGTTATTQDQSDNSTKLATTAYVDTGLGSIDVSGLVPGTRTVNSKALSADVSLTASDVSAVALQPTSKSISVSDSPYTSTSAHNLLLVDTTDGPISVILPTVGNRTDIKWLRGVLENPITVIVESSGTIDGDASSIFAALKENRTFVNISTGNWVML